MITEAELYNDKWRIRDNLFYKLGVYLIPDRSDIESAYMWQFVIKDEQGLYIMRSPMIPFKNVAQLERIIKWQIREVIFDPSWPILAKLSSKLKRTLKNWII